MTVRDAPARLLPNGNVPCCAGDAVVRGRRFSGVSQKVNYGLDYAAATNYPLVRLHYRERHDRVLPCPAALDAGSLRDGRAATGQQAFRSDAPHEGSVVSLVGIGADKADPCHVSLDGRGAEMTP